MTRKREIVLDTETTGLNPTHDRIVEIGCVEMVDGVSTGNRFQCYVNPERSVPAEAEQVHGLSDEFLADKPVFADVVDDLLSFIGDARLVIHNAPFDLGFLNAEIRRVKREQFANDRATDTLTLARTQYPGKANDLDALCKRVLNHKQRRGKHGALTDAVLLADIYVELTGGRQSSLLVSSVETAHVSAGISPSEWTPKLVYPSDAEAAAHAAFIATIPNAIWMAG